jgi:hypothetical protein
MAGLSLDQPFDEDDDVPTGGYDDTEPMMVRLARLPPPPTDTIRPPARAGWAHVKRS